MSFVPPERQYNGLTGEEIRERLVLEVERVLAQDPRLQMHLVYHNVTLDLVAILTSYPAEPPSEQIAVKVSAGESVESAPFAPEKVILESSADLRVPDLVREELSQARKKGKRSEKRA